MADVTFGVKVSEEMKGELSELMKSTQLTGKEFMNLLIHTYKLEKEKAKDTIIGSDIDELQRLLQRIQHLYINMNERTTLVVEERMREKDQLLKTKDAQIENLEKLKEEIETLKEEVESQHKAFEQQLVDKESVIKSLEEQLMDQKIQIKQQNLLEEKFEQEIKGLQEEITNYNRLKLEIEERNEENSKLKNRTDELASEIWFMQRENEKLQKEQTTLLEKKEQLFLEVNNRHELELKNALLEQKLQFNQKIDLLKEDHFKIQQDLNTKMQDLLISMKKENE